MTNLGKVNNNNQLPRPLTLRGQLPTTDKKNELNFFLLVKFCPGIYPECQNRLQLILSNDTGITYKELSCLRF